MHSCAHASVLVAWVVTVVAFGLGAPARAARAAQPSGHWQTPGPFQTVSGHWQTPGPIQVPKGIQAIKATTQPCTKRYTIGADALFTFNSSSLSPDAVKTLDVLGPILRKAGAHPVHIDGYTDAIGSVDYNQTLS